MIRLVIQAKRSWPADWRHLWRVTATAERVRLRSVAAVAKGLCVEHDEQDGQNRCVVQGEPVPE